MSKTVEQPLCRFYCIPCGFVYDPAVGDPDAGVSPGIAFAELPNDWICPICGANRDLFLPLDEET